MSITRMQTRRIIDVCERRDDAPEWLAKNARAAVRHSIREKDCAGWFAGHVKLVIVEDDER